MTDTLIIVPGRLALMSMLQDAFRQYVTNVTYSFFNTKYIQVCTRGEERRGREEERKRGREEGGGERGEWAMIMRERGERESGRGNIVTLLLPQLMPYKQEQDIVGFLEV